MAESRELLEASDLEIEEAVRHADPTVLRGALYQLTGDESIAATEAVPLSLGLYTAGVVAKPADVAFIQGKAAEFLKTHRDHGAGNIESGPPERLRRSLGLAAGEEIAESDMDMWLEELALNPWARGLECPKQWGKELLHQ